jgi:glycosyltransferase involved in cell wall biosynthesis
LARRGNQITLLALIPPGEDTNSLDTLREWCYEVKTVPLPRWQTLKNGLQAIPGRAPLQAAYSRSSAMAALIRQTQAASTFDVAHIEHLRGAELSHAVNGLPLVFDSVDSITLLFDWVSRSGPTWRSRWLARLDVARTRRYEGQLLDRYSRVLITSPKDKQALAQLSTAPDTDKRLVVLPNGVDLDYFTPLEMPRDPATIIFTGKMSYHANVAAALDLAQQVMPLVWQQHPQAKLVLAGKDPSPELTALAADSRITVTGTVPDLRPYLAQATVAVSPMRYGVGIQNKILEAMAMATPVITTSHTLAALQTQVDRDILAGDTPEAIAQEVNKLLANDQLCRHLGQAGRRYVETHHDWNVAAERLEGIYREVISAAKI